MKIIAGIFGGLLMAIVGMILIILSTTEFSSSLGITAFFLLWIIGIVVAIKSERAGKAWKRILMTSGIFLFL